MDDKNIRLDQAQETLRIINNNLTLLIKEKRALKQFIEDELDRIENKPSLKSRAYELKKDKEFIAEHGRERTVKEIARLMYCSQRQVYRYLQEEKD